MAALKKIVVIGPESTGKSTLCEQLAQHYHTTWCPEYAREYLTTNGLAYTFEDLLAIAKGQVALEEAAVKREWPIVNGEEVHGPLPIVHSEYDTGKSIRYSDDDLERSLKNNYTGLETGNRKPETLFIDTDLYVMKVWCEYVFNKCHTYILEQIALRKYDLYLFCNIDLPWQEDPQREYPDEKPRQELYRIYKDLLVNQSTPWADISGGYEERMLAAIAAVDKILYNYHQ